MSVRASALLLLTTLACAHERERPRPVTVSMVATSDLHGRIEALPWLAGHLNNLRRRRASDGGVLLIDSGDMFQGTLESNLAEGSPVVKAYNALGYDAAAIGNHEFDFGPPGPDHLAIHPGQDPRGALKQRAAEAHFPFLAANLREPGGAPSLAWPNVRPYTLVKVSGVPVGVVGVTTIDTPRATHPGNFGGLEVLPLVERIAAAARQARQAGAVAVVVAAHAGGECRRFDDPDDLSSCRPDEEIFRVARALPPGLVDVIAAGHTHQGVAHRVAGIAIVQSFSGGRAFGRVDLTVEGGRVTGARLFPPRRLCEEGTFADCHTLPYEGMPVHDDPTLRTLLAPDLARAADRREQPVGVTLPVTITRAGAVESPLGDLAADLMRAAQPRADVAFINGGSLRAYLPGGLLRYGALYEAFPFDDALALVPLDAARLAAVLARNLQSGFGILSLSGLRARATCRSGALEVRLLREDGGEVPPATPLLAVTNGYLASGGDGLLQGIARAPEAELPVRDAFAAVLAARGGELRSVVPSPRRFEYPGTRPVDCTGEAKNR